jgi:hypothetical protein
MIYNLDLIPRAADAGLDTVVRSLSYETIEDMPEFLAQMNSQITPLRVTYGPLLQYLADRQAVGELLDVGCDEALPEPITRPDAPTGLGAAEWGVWFSAPDSGTSIVRWYVNGALKLRREHDLATNRSVTMEELGAQAGDVVQIAIEAGGVVGWWARIGV